MRCFALLLMCTLCCQLHSQQLYRVYFRDKMHNDYSVDMPQEFLSHRSIARRRRMDIPIMETDLPLSSLYLSRLRKAPCEIILTSRWMNYALVSASIKTIERIERWDFIKDVKTLKPLHGGIAGKMGDASAVSASCSPCGEYGLTYTQIGIMNTGFLHGLGYTGGGMLLAVLDAGFAGVDTMAAFRCLRSEGRISYVRDVVGGGKQVYAHSTHGSKVLGLMAGYLHGRYTGSAPDADYALIRTEDTSSETPAEEDYWLAGAEFADSIGADIINSSLGYRAFDDTLLNHNYQDMDGNTTVVTRAADMAAAKGILVVNAAGNEGDKPWHFIIAPADGDSVLTVGSVDSNGTHAPGSSQGPTADSRIKPDVVALGKGAVVLQPNGLTAFENGTSFAAPLLAGSAACLWQAAMSKDNMDVLHAIRSSGSISHTPNNILGWGIPDFSLAYEQLTGNNPALPDADSLSVYPNPASDDVNIFFHCGSDDNVELCIYDALGELIHRETLATCCGTFRHTLPADAFRSTGVYLIRCSFDKKSLTRKLLRL